MKNCLLIIGILLFAQGFFAQGPLTGTLIINKGEIKRKWGDTINYEFKVKNAGTAAIDIKKVTGSCDCQTTYTSNIQTIQPGKTGIIKVTIKMNKEQLQSQVKNGVIDYDKTVLVDTNGKKARYQLYTRATIKLTN